MNSPLAPASMSVDTITGLVWIAMLSSRAGPWVRKVCGMFAGITTVCPARRNIASVAARLFAEHTYERVTVGDVARAAGVSPQTVFNYFPTKGDLVTDRDADVRRRLPQLIRERPPGTSPAAAIRPFVLAGVASIADLPSEEWRGEIGHLAVLSPAVHRLSLEMSDRQAAAIAEAIRDSTDATPAVARLHAIALAGVFQIIFGECGRRTRDGEPQRQVAEELTAIVEEVLDELERWTPA